MEYGLIIVWALAYMLLSVMALPFCAIVFSRFPGRGAAFAVPLALAVLGVVGYLFGHIVFGWPTLIAGLAILGAGSSLALARYDAEPDFRSFAESSLIFMLAFGFIIAVRAVDPAVHPIGGEKFLDYGLLRSLLRTTTLPPEDMWFAGKSVQYYYGGHLLSALLAKLTFTAPRYAYNLALAGFYAAVVTAGYGLAGAIAAEHGVSRRLAGGLCAFFIALAANLYTFAQTAVWALPDNVAARLTAVLGVPQSAVGWQPTQFSYWSASRVMSSEPASPDAFSLITEFPLFAWLNGDLHAHMTSTPFLLLIAAIGFAYWQTPTERLTRRRLLIFGVIPPIAGLVAVVNTWSFPTVLGVTWLVLTFAPAPPLSLLPRGAFDRFRGSLTTLTRLTTRLTASTSRSGWRGRSDQSVFRRELSQTGGALILITGLVVIGVIWSLPFWLGTATGRSVGVVPAANRSSLGGLLIVHGGFLLAFIPYVARRGFHVSTEPALLALTVVLGAAAAWAFGLSGLALFGPLLIGGWYLLRTRTDAGYEMLLMIAGLGIAVLVEFLFVVEEAGPGRMNTVFKTYAQMWMLWSVAVGVMLARLTTVSRESFPSVAGSDRLWQVTSMGIVICLIIATGLYAGFALPQHFDRGSQTTNTLGPTLDATAFIQVQHPEEAAAISYIDTLDGTPTIVTGAPGGYRWDPSAGNGASAAASLTGVPTVAGWYHERGYRGSEVYSTRVDDVRTIYTGTQSEQQELLAAYNVQYVYVGPAERARYRTITITNHPGVSVVESFDAVTLYRVDQSVLNG
jgi:YYY domain-containing protein